MGQAVCLALLPCLRPTRLQTVVSIAVMLILAGSWRWRTDDERYRMTTHHKRGCRASCPAPRHRLQRRPASAGYKRGSTRTTKAARAGETLATGGFDGCPCQPRGRSHPLSWHRRRGDEESRTPVHNTFKTDFYKFSLFFIFIFTAPTNRFYKNISFLNTHCFER